MFDLIFGSPITVAAWLLGSGFVAYWAFRYNRALNDRNDALDERDDIMKHAPTWLRTIEPLCKEENMLTSYSYMNIGLPYVRACFERFAPECYNKVARELASRHERQIKTGEIIYSSINTKQDWLKIYQYLKMAQDASPYDAIPIAGESIGEFKDFCPNRLYTCFHECIGFRYVPCDKDKLLFENSHWPRPIGDAVTFRVLKTGSSVSFDVEIAERTPSNIWGGIDVKKVRRVYEIPTMKNGGYHFVQARSFNRHLKTHSLSYLIRVYRTDYLVRLSDINTISCDITGLRVVIPRPSADGKSFDTCGGMIKSSTRWNDGTYEVAIKEPFRKYFENADKIWVDPRYLYVWIKKETFKTIDPNEGEHDQIIIGTVLGSDKAEIRYALGDIYLTRDMKPLEEKYPNVIGFKNSVKSKYSMHIIYIDDTIYVCNNQKLHNPVGVNVWWTTDEASSKMQGPSIIMSTECDSYYRIDYNNGIPKELTFFALDPRYYSKFGEYANSRNKSICILGKLKGLEYWLLMNTDAPADGPVFYVVTKSNYETITSQHNLIFINNETGAIRIFGNGCQAECDRVELLAPNSNLKYVYDRSRNVIMMNRNGTWESTGMTDPKRMIMSKQIEQVRQDTSNLMKLVDSVEQMANASHIDALIPSVPSMYSRSPVDWKKGFVQEDEYVPRPIEEVEMDPHYTFVSIPSDFKAGRDTHTMWGSYHEYLFYTGTGNTMAYDIYDDRIIFKGTTGGSIAIETDYCPDYSVPNAMTKSMDVVLLYIPDALILPIRQAFLFYAAQGMFHNPIVRKANYRINESLLYQAAESTIHREGEIYGTCRCDLLYPGVVINDKYVSTLNLVHSSDPNGDTVLISHLQKLTKTEELSISRVAPIRNSIGEMIAYSPEEKAAASISHYDLTMKHEITFTSIAMPKYNWM